MPQTSETDRYTINLLSYVSTDSTLNGSAGTTTYSSLSLSRTDYCWLLLLLLMLLLLLLLLSLLLLLRLAAHNCAAAAS